jgi:hypothetical protein
VRFSQNLLSSLQLYHYQICETFPLCELELELFLSTNLFQYKCIHELCDLMELGFITIKFTPHANLTTLEIKL